MYITRSCLLYYTVFNPLVSFVHCFVCPSLIYVFLLPLGIFVHYFVCPSLIYVLLLPLGILCPLFCLSLIDLRLLITPWYLLSIILSVLHWLTPSYYPLVSFVHYFVCPLIYAFLLPLGIFCPLFFLSFIDLRLLITPWYLLSIILSVLHWFTSSYYPLVSLSIILSVLHWFTTSYYPLVYFVHYIVSPSLIYAFLLLVWIVRVESWSG